MVELIRYTEKVNDLLKRYGVKFGIYKDHIFHEQLFPFDCLPRIITKEEFEYLSEGLIQRVDALNAFLNDVYGEKNIINDNVILPAVICRSAKVSFRRKTFILISPASI